jgi:hypothetical protein
MKKQDAYEYAENFKKGGNPPWLHGLYLHWRKLFNEPYQGVTSDGRYPVQVFLLEARLTIFRRRKRWSV